MWGWFVIPGDKCCRTVQDLQRNVKEKYRTARGDTDWVGINVGGCHFKHIFRGNSQAGQRSSLPESISERHLQPIWSHFRRNPMSCAGDSVQNGLGSLQTDAVGTTSPWKTRILHCGTAGWERA